VLGVAAYSLKYESTFLSIAKILCQSMNQIEMFCKKIVNDNYKKL